MRKHPVFSLLLLFMFLPALPPQGASQQEDKAWRQELEAWRARRAESLTAPEGWLSLAGLEWLKDGENCFGSAGDNPIRLGGNAPAHLGVLHVENRTVRLRPPEGGFPAELQVDGQSAQTQLLRTDEDPRPSKLTAGTLTLLVIHRGDRLALRIKDLQAPTRANFHGLNWFAPDVSYRVRGRWIPYVPPKTLSLATIVRTKLELPSPGVAEFVLQGKRFRLEPVLEDPDAKELFFILRDTTSRTTTYGAARFLYASFPDHGLTQAGELWLDFNRLQNPPCAYSPYATCPLPPPQNRLAVALPVGEKRYHK